jgi:hypothetical protein
MTFRRLDSVSVFRWNLRTSSIDWAQLSRFHLETEAEFSLRSVVCFKQKQDDEECPETIIILKLTLRNSLLAFLRV